MSIPASLKPENGPLGRAFAAWLDQAATGAASRFVLLWFVILYTAFGIISTGRLGLPYELLQTYALGVHPAAGYAGHAPLAPWVVGAWFRLFPPNDWAFHLLAVLNAAVGLFAADRIARLSLDGDKPITVLLLLLLTPIYQIMGQRFGAAETMLSTWPIATLCFLRAFATRDLAWSAATGVAASLAVLGHYDSVFLIAGFIVAVLTHPGRGTFLRSAAPWLMAVAGAVVLAPHAAWLTARFLEMHRSGVTAPLFDAGARYAHPLWHGALAAAGVGIMLVIYAVAVRPSPAILRETVWPGDPEGRMLVILLAVPLALTLLSALFAGTAAPWPLASWFLLPIILLRPKAAVLTRTAAIRIAALVAASTIAALGVAPWLGWRRHREEASEGAYYRLVGTEVTKAWRLATGQPLRVVMGDPRLTAAAAFYSSDHPDAVPGFETGAATPSVTPESLARDGFATICRTDDAACVNAAKQRTAGKSNTQYITYSTFDRSLGKPRLERFFFILAPPESKPAIILR